jgi:hypothetical protein
MPTDLQTTLETLTAQPSTEHPYLSVYLDWRPDGNGERLSLRALEDDLNTIAARLQARGANLDSFNTDRERIMDYVTNQAPVDARGIAIFACDAESIWEPITLQVPVETKIVEDRFPHCFNLARIIDDYETYAIVLATARSRASWCSHTTMPNRRPRPQRTKISSASRRAGGLRWYSSVARKTSSGHIPGISPTGSAV